ncbi:MAG TPA: PH domain-containing protein [Nitriliruptoraceae bacterium]|nr:PH domain-containing protein [Nitriliruptoraceae bacterium]
MTLDPPDTAPHRLPLRSLIGGISPRALWGLFPAFFVLRDTGLGFIAILAAFFVVAQVARFIVWTRFRWGFDGQVVRISSGILWQRDRAVDVERIQQVEVQRPLLHQVMGTAVVTVETASEGGESEIRLDGLDNDTATALQAAILTARRRQLAAAPGAPPPDPTGTAPSTIDTEEPTTSILKPPVADLVRSALTGSSLLVVPVSILALGEFAFDVFGNDIDEVATEAARAGARLGYLTVAMVVLVVGAIGAVVTTLLRDWDIELVRRGDDLRLTRGLLTRHATTIPLHRLQVVQYRQNWLRRAMGAGTLVVHSAGGGTPASPNEGGGAKMSIPWVTTADLPGVLGAALERSLRTHGDLPENPHRHPPAARRRLVWKWARGLAALVGLVVAAVAVLDVNGLVTVGGSGWAGVLLAALLFVAGGAWLFSGTQYRRLGHTSTPRVVLVTGGVLGATSDWMPLGRLQGVEGTSTVFQRRLDLASVHLAPAGTGNAPVVITDVATATADDLGDHFTLVAAGRPATIGTSAAVAVPPPVRQDAGSGSPPVLDPTTRPGIGPGGGPGPRPGPTMPSGPPRGPGHPAETEHHVDP